MSPARWSHCRRNSSSSSSRSSRSIVSCGALIAFNIAIWVALLAILYPTPASAFLAPSSPFPTRSARGGGSGGGGAPGSARLAKHATRVAPLSGIKRKVKVDMEENYSGRIVDKEVTGMFGGGDPNALFDMIEKNKKKTAEAAEAAAATTAGEAGGTDEEKEEEDGGGSDGPESEKETL